MRTLLWADLDALADAEDLAEFRRCYAALDPARRRVLMMLIPRLLALQERGDMAAALALVTEIRRIVATRERPSH